jgi:hypothetical protein
LLAFRCGLTGCQTHHETSKVDVQFSQCHEPSVPRINFSFQAFDTHNVNEIIPDGRTQYL